DHAVTELLLNFEREIHVLQLQSFVDLRDAFARKSDVHDGADNLRDLAFGSCHKILSPKNVLTRLRPYFHGLRPLVMACGQLSWGIAKRDPLHNGRYAPKT